MRNIINKTKTEKTISAYDKNHKKYADKFMHFASYTEKIELFQKRYLLQPKSILDLGCGPGNNIRLLKNNNPEHQITGVDLSQKMIELAKVNVPDANYRVADIRSISTEDRFDAVIASFCIVHLQNDETVNLIQRISSILTEGGFFYLSFMTGKDSVFEKTSFSEEEMYFNYYEIDEIEKHLKSVGLNVVEKHEEDYQEDDGTMTRDIFIFAQKGNRLT